MKKIKEILNNENNIEKLFKNNNNNQLKTLQNKYMITEYNFSSNTSRKLHKFGKTTINFNNIINSEKKPIHIQNPFKKINNSKDESHNKIKLKLKLTNINKNKSNLNSNTTRDIVLPNVKALSLNYPKKNALNSSRQNKIYINNFYKSVFSLNDTPKINLKNKYNETMVNMLSKSQEKKNEDRPNEYLNTENNLFNKNKEINDENKYKYSIILKNLDSWDKEHCKELIDKSDDNLFNYLYSYYQKNNLIEEKKNLIFASNILKTRANYNNLIEKVKKNNKLFIDMIKRKKIETGTILNNTLYKAKLKFSELFNKNYSKEFDEHLDIDPETLNLLIEEEVKSVFYNQVIKDKIKYENQLHDELMKVNSIIFDRKNLKNEKTAKLKELFLEKNLLKKEYNEKYTKNRNSYWFQYDNYEHHYKRLITNSNIKSTMNLNNGVGNENDINNNIHNDNENNLKNYKFSRTKSIIIDQEKKYSKSPSPSKKFRRKLTMNEKKALKDLKKQIKDLEDEKNFKLLHMNNEMNSKLKIIYNNYQNKIDDINAKQKKIENEIKIIKNELVYYKKINDELQREYKLYYMEKLKKGYDCRRDGLMWIVMNLLELQIPLEYHHFPKYLTHEQVDYIKKYANLQLKQNELKIIINVLKKKQNTQKMNDVLKCMDVIDNIMEIDNNDNIDDYGNSNSNNNRIKNKDFIVAKNKINKKFVKLYQDNIEIMKNYLNKNIENHEFNQVINELKKDLYHGSNSAIKKSKRDVLHVFMGDNKNKNFFQFLMDIKSNFQQLEEEKDKIFENQKQIFLELINNTNPSSKVSIINAIKNEMIKRCLFGTRLDN